MIISFNVVISIAANVGIVQVTNSFGNVISEGTAGNVVNLMLGVAPLLCFLSVYQRHAARPFRRWELPTAGLAFTAYTYVWIFATARALLRLFFRRRNWVKAPHVLTEHVGGSGDLVVAES